MTFGMIHLRGPRLGIDGEQLIHQRDDACRVLVFGIDLDGIDVFATRVRQATGMHHGWPADTVFVCGVAVGLQDAVELAEKLFWPFALAAHAEIENHRSTWRSVLPQVGLMIAPALVVR